MNKTLFFTIVLITNSLLFGARVAPTPRAADRPATSVPITRQSRLQRGRTEGDLLGTKPRSRRIAVALVEPETRTLIVYDAEIHQAAAVDDLDELRHLLIINPTMLNFRDKETGNTPLHAAVIAGYPRIVRYLLEQNADRDIANDTGMLAAELATTAEIKKIFINDQRIRDMGAAVAEQQDRKIRELFQIARSYNSTDGDTGQTPRSQARTQPVNTSGCGCIIC